MIADPPVLHNRIRQHLPPTAPEPTPPAPAPLPKTPAERLSFWNEAVFAAIRHHVQQLNDPKTADKAAAVIIDLEKCRLRHRQHLAGTKEPALEPIDVMGSLPPVDRCSPIETDSPASRLADDDNDFDDEFEDEEDFQHEMTLGDKVLKARHARLSDADRLRQWPDTAVYTRADAIQRAMQNGTEPSPFDRAVLKKAEDFRRHEAECAQMRADAGLKPFTDPILSLIPKEPANG
jgi:hypothetical protein